MQELYRAAGQMVFACDKLDGKLKTLNAQRQKVVAGHGGGHAGKPQA